MRMFEDFTLGESRHFGTTHLDEATLLDFSRLYDPQPMHLDAQSEQARLTGGLIASGWQTASLNMRQFADHVLHGSSGMGSPGIDRLRWLKPVRAGDTLESRYTVIGMRRSATKPDRGFINFRMEVVNQAGEAVLEQINLVMFGCRSAEGDSVPLGTLPAAQHKEAFPIISAGDSPSIAAFSTLLPGTLVRLGERHFPADEIIRFARAYDPQPFHLSEEAGRASHFGGLAASGWHTAAGWMHTIIAYWQAEAAAGRPVACLGPSPGFRDLVWLKPVLAGDTLTYYARILEARLSQSRPGWGLVTQRNYAINQHGNPVFAFSGTVLWEANA